MTNRATEEKLVEILAACEGVTPGPWKAEGLPYAMEDPVVASASDQYVCQTVYDMQSITVRESVDADTRHIANCDPDTIRSIITELLELRKPLPPAPADSGAVAFKIDRDLLRKQIESDPEEGEIGVGFELGDIEAMDRLAMAALPAWAREEIIRLRTTVASPSMGRVTAYSEAQRMVYDKLAQEGGGTWATYMMQDIEAAFAAPPDHGGGEGERAQADWAYLAACIEMHADKFPVPEHIRLFIEPLRALTRSQP